MNVVVVGVGNAYRGDDGAGLDVAQRLRERVPGGVRVHICEQEPSRLLDAWEGADVAFVVDAVASGAAAGTVHRFEAGAELPARIFGSSSTHALGVADA
ncbi:MAG: hydrogenase maturation protease, partial [Gaiellaceae bacterium]